MKHSSGRDCKEQELRPKPLFDGLLRGPGELGTSLAVTPSVIQISTDLRPDQVLQGLIRAPVLGTQNQDIN